MFIKETYSAPSIQAHVNQIDEALREEGYTGEWEEEIRSRLPDGAGDMLNLAQVTKGEVRES